MRKEGWEERLSELFEAAAQKKFIWGRHDCALFALACFKTITGRASAIGDICGRYKSANGAARLIKRLGASDLAGAADLAFGRRLETPLLAQRGDIVLLEVPEQALGVCSGSEVVFVSEEGFVTRSLLDCAVAWRVS